MKQQQLADKSLTIDQPVGIGGEVEFVVLRDQKIHIETAYRFDSYINVGWVHWKSSSPRLA